MNRILLTTLLIIAFALSGCGSKSNALKPAKLKSFSETAKLSKVWQKDFGRLSSDEHIRLSPYFDDSRIYTTDTKGKLSAFQADGGELIWKARVKRHITGGVGVGDDNVYVATKSGTIIALASADGKKRWEKKITSEVLSPPVSASGTVIVQTADGKLIALSADTGKRKWNYRRQEPSLSLRGTSSPIIFQGIVITGFASGNIVAVRIADGRVLWEIPVVYPRGRNEIERLVDIDVPAIIGKDLLFSAGYQGKLVAINLRTGRMEWSKKFSTHTGMGLDDQNIYLSDDSGNIVAFDQRTGASLWKQSQFTGRGVTAPAVLGKHLVVGDYQGYVHILDKDIGVQVGRYRLSSDAIVSRPVTQDDTLYVNNMGGDIAALRLN